MSPVMSRKNSISPSQSKRADKAQGETSLKKGRMSHATKAANLRLETELKFAASLGLISPEKETTPLRTVLQYQSRAIKGIWSDCDKLLLTGTQYTEIRRDETFDLNILEGTDKHF
jgi:hypothetical protein